MCAEPWLANWKIEDELPAGGQGETYRVKHAESNQMAVLKKLKKQGNAEARRRMCNEVTHLKTLRPAGCKVPAVLESNVDSFESLGIPLYFVMEYIPGMTLAELVADRKGLTLDESAAILFDVSSTVRAALKMGISHRDLKPENIIVRSLQPADVVILDYGLSFNHLDPDIVTRTSEKLDNSLISLPERRRPGGERRDTRSDLTGLCALLYFCIMAERPVDLSDEKKRPPHRRPGRTIDDKMKDDPRIPQLNAFFDRGFDVDIDLRFQTVDELTERLTRLLEAAAQATAENPFAFAQESAPRLLQHDRNTRLAAYKVNAQKAVQTLFHELPKYASGKLEPYCMSHTGIDPPVKVAEGDDLGSAFSVMVKHYHNPYAVVISYQVRAKEPECVLYRCFFKDFPQGKDGLPSPAQAPTTQWLAAGQWDPVYYFSGLTTPDPSVLMNDLSQCVTRAMKMLEHEILLHTEMG